MSIVSKTVNLFIIGFIIAIMIPVAFSIFYSQSTTGWSTTLTSVWYMVPVLAMVALLLGLIYYVFYGRSNQAKLYYRWSFAIDRKAMARLTPGVIVGMVVAIIIFSILMPTAISLLVEKFANYSTVGAPSSSTPNVGLVVTLGQLLPLFLVLSIVIALIIGLRGRGE